MIYTDEQESRLVEAYNNGSKVLYQSSIRGLWTQETAEKLDFTKTYKISTTVESLPSNMSDPLVIYEYNNEYYYLENNILVSASTCVSSDNMANLGGVITGVVTTNPETQELQIVQTNELSAVAVSGLYNDLGGTPSIGDGEVTLLKNGEDLIGTFNLNDLSNKSITIPIPTKVSDIDNDSGFLSEHQSLAPLTSRLDNLESDKADKSDTYTKSEVDTKVTSIDSDISVSTGSQYSIGSTDKKLKAIYVDEVYISNDTLYVNNVPVLGTSEDTITVKADPDQSLSIKTTGEGVTQVVSESEVSISASGINSSVKISSKGSNGVVSIASDKDVNISASNISLSGTTTIDNLNVTGTTTIVNSDNLKIKDNIIELNIGETGEGVTKGSAGIKVDRGEELPYLIQFDESDDLFKIGIQGDLETIATRDYVGIELGKKYTKPIDGIPSTDLSSDVQSSLSKANSALQSHQDISGKLNKSDLINLVYPVGSVYLSVNDVSPQAFLGGTWEKVSSGRVLQGADSSHAGGTTIEAGLPNITGSIWWNNTWKGGGADGAFTQSTTSLGGYSGSGTDQYSKYTLNASNSSSIYGNSTTVQPPAFVVYIWKRTA